MRPVVATGGSGSSTSMRLLQRLPGLQDVYDRVQRAAGADCIVLVTGETGAGKDVVVRAIHEGSSRSTEPFVKVNCGALPSDLLSSELFGHELGSFTGAARRRIGAFERAGRGTLCMDEVFEMMLKDQVKLLTAIEDRTFQRVGGEVDIPFQARLIAASNVDVEQMMAAGRLRPDFFERLNVYRIHVPPLRARVCDIEPLAKHLLTEAAERNGRVDISITPEATDLLKRHQWPRNVRSLRNVLERALVLVDNGATITRQGIADSLIFDGFSSPQDHIHPSNASLATVGAAEPRSVLEPEIDLGGGGVCIDFVALEAVWRAPDKNGRKPKIKHLFLEWCGYKPAAAPISYKQFSRRFRAYRLARKPK